MLTTENRPAPLPARPAQPSVAGAGRKPLPAGAVRWSKTYLDDKGLPQRAGHDVPVDDNDKRTAHVRHVCVGDGKRASHIEVGGVKQPCDQVAWLLPGDPVKHCPDHGCQLVPDGAKPNTSLLPWAAMWQALEPSARPAYLLAIEVAAGVAIHNADVPAWEVLAATPTLAGAAWWSAKHWLTRRAIEREKLEEGQDTGRQVRKIARRARYAGYATTVAGAWLTLAAATDPHTGPGRALWASLPVCWALSAAPWWRRLAGFRNRPQVQAPADPEATAPESSDVNPAALQDAADWAEHVAITGKLPNTAVDLATWAADDGGRRMVIRATRGALTDERVRQALPDIAAAFGVKRSAVGWVEEHEGSPRALLLLVQPNSPLNETVPGEPIGIVPVEQAVVHMGLRIDGGRLVTRLWTPGWGAPSRLIIGTKGSGKTELLRRLLLAMLKVLIQTANGPTRLVAPFLHDPKRGADYGAFRRQVCGFSIDSYTLHMIVEAFAREMDRRYDALASTVWTDEKGRAREGERPFDPTTMGPILSLIADEFHIDAKDAELMGKLDPFARKMRAAGIEINVATHLATIGDTGSQGFRDMLGGGEAWLLRTTLGLNASLATGGTLTGDPRLLPRVPGMVLHASGEEATMQARIAYTGSEELYDLLYDDDNASLIQPIDWPAETLEAFGTEFVEWMAACQSRPVGAPAPTPPKTVGRAVSAEDRSARDALWQIMLEAETPLQRKQVAEHRLWGTRGVTSTLTKALKDGRDAGWLRRLDGGLYEMSMQERVRAADALGEALKEAGVDLDSVVAHFGGGQ